MTIPPDKPLKIFCSYSHKDERHLNNLRGWLRGLEREGLIDWWHDRKISPGWEWEEAIDQNLRNADIIPLLLTPDFMASDYVFEKEIDRAIERHERDEARVIPIIIRPADWQWASFGKLQALPEDAKPINEWSNRDRAWLDVVRGIRKAVQELMSKPREDERGDLSDPQPAAERIQGETKVQLFNERDSASHQLQQMREMGLTRMHDHLSSDLLKPRFLEAPEKLQVLETWTGFRSAGIAAWTREAVERGSEVQILLLNPNSIQVEYRALALDYSVASVRDAIIGDLEVLDRERRKLSQKAEYKDRLQIRVYDAAPVLLMYRFENTGMITRLIGMYFRGAEAAEGPQLEVTNKRNDTSSTFVRLLDQIFNSLWNDKKTIDASEVIQET